MPFGERWFITQARVGPAHAGMRPLNGKLSPFSACWPRVCGDAPCTVRGSLVRSRLASRMCGCTVVTRLRRMRHNVHPAPARGCAVLRRRSSPLRGCIGHIARAKLAIQVHPAHAWMYPATTSGTVAIPYSPRACGDVPDGCGPVACLWVGPAYVGILLSSTVRAPPRGALAPRMWRYPLSGHHARRPRAVGPADAAGMYLRGSPERRPRFA